VNYSLSDYFFNASPPEPGKSFALWREKYAKPFMNRLGNSDWSPTESRKLKFVSKMPLIFRGPQ
jgi:hypothetical protein